MSLKANAVYALLVAANKPLRNVCRELPLDEEVVLRVADELGVNIIGGFAALTPARKVELAVIAIKGGVSLTEVCRALSASDFEAFVEEAFKAGGYLTERNVRLRRPRVEIDILAENENLLVGVDFKRWNKPLYPSTAAKLLDKQLERLKAYKRAVGKKKPAVPLIVTLLERDWWVVDRKPVIPVSKLNSFISVLPSLVDELEIA